MARVAFLLLALFAEMERTFTAERAAHARRGRGLRPAYRARMWPGIEPIPIEEYKQTGRQWTYR
ncbi:MAG: hypothetical protein ACR2JX_03620 [Mycobacteriales bacterium]